MYWEDGIIESIPDYFLTTVRRMAEHTPQVV